MKHLNPRQGITTCRLDNRLERLVILCVKHLNPRQGITTGETTYPPRTPGIARVKHLNPRQGITTALLFTKAKITPAAIMCETPKSPPGDYNAPVAEEHKAERRIECETPKSPPGDYNNTSKETPFALNTAPGVKHLNPRQGITTKIGRWSRSEARQYRCETPKSPPGDYNYFCARQQ